MPINSGGLYPHHINDNRTPITALRHKFRVSEALHQLYPGTRYSGGAPASRGRLA
jgi:hypothetical protein